MKKYLLILCAWLATCTGYDTISDREMEAILTEALLTNAIASRAAGYPEPGAQGDTVDYYTPILDRYDYTLDDFRGTIREMATRKSNPLAEIFTRVNNNIDSLALVAEYRYRALLRYDSIALAFFADTLYRKDTTVRGTLAKLRMDVSRPAAGIYRLTFAYRSTEDYRVGTKSVVFRTDPKGLPQQRLWIDRAVRDTAKFSGEFRLNLPADTLIATFEEPSVAKQYAKEVRDTSFVRNVMLVYTPPVERARRDYILHMLREIDFLKYSLPNAKDSLPLPFRR